MAASLRLTLRTLLSYLDDTLEPAQAKLIGQKVAESEQARELMERIKQVTRKRRLTTPPPAGPGGIDANTIAEYLDNEVTPEQAEEVERICLASDVHLAEVAACHQILTLVLGEPALVPPSARQRMYGLVKGPEAIPFRKPPRKSTKADLDLSTSDAGLEGDESMRMPGFMRNASVRNTVLLVGGGVLAACMLVVALWNFLRTSSGEVDTRGKDQVVQVDPNKDKTEHKADPNKDDDKKAAEDKKKADDKKAAEEKALADEKKKADEKKLAEDKKTPTETATGQEEIPFEDADLKPVVLGQYQPNAKVPEVLLQQEAGAKGTWARVAGNSPNIASVRPLLSLPGSRGSVQLKKGVHLTLWGTMPEIWPNPYLFESKVRLFGHPMLDLDMALDRGRVVIANTRTDGKPALMRIRFDNPLQKKQDAFTIALMDQDAEVMIDHVAYFRLDEPFYEDKDNPNRIGPTIEMHCFLLSGTAYFRWAGNLDFVDARKQPQYIRWSSLRGSAEPPQPFTTPDWMLKEPKQGDPKLRNSAMQASQRLALNLQNKQLDVALQEALESENAASKRLALLAYTALDDYTKPVEYMDKEDVQLADLRRTAVYALRNWMAQGLDNEYQVYQAFMPYKRVVAKKIMELLHGTTQKEAAIPATWQRLINDLNNPVLPLRELSAWNLEILVPAGGKLAAAYSASLPEAQRQAIQAAWRQVIPPGQLPPQPGQPMPMPKKQ
jgi:hypothetical protein